MLTVQNDFHGTHKGGTLWNESELLKPLERKYFDSLYDAYEEMKALLSQQPLGVIGLDSKGCIGFCNPSALRVLSIRSNPIGQYWRKVLPFSEWLKDEIASLARRPSAGPFRLYTRIETAPVGERWIEVELRRLANPSDHALIFVDEVNFATPSQVSIEPQQRIPGFVGVSAAMQNVYKQIEAVACADCTVLIEGETGTGKELAARAVHALSRRSDKPFLAVNCAGLNDTLWGSQLFGHTRGAFTGAINDCAGLFEAAGSGTLFLDEIGDMPMTVQMSLLRVLQEREVVRLGEVTPRKVRARILAATNRDLKQAVKDRAFREDLLYRIQVARVQVPPLRVRTGDLHHLIRFFLKGIGAAKSKGIVGVDAQVMNLLEAHPWPGNIRELENVLEYSAIQCEGRVISVGDLPPEFLLPVTQDNEEDDPASLDKGRIVDALRRAGGRRVDAARLLGVSRATLYRRLKELDLSRKECTA